MNQIFLCNAEVTLQFKVPAPKHSRSSLKIFISKYPAFPIPFHPSRADLEKIEHKSYRYKGTDSPDMKRQKVLSG